MFYSTIQEIRNTPEIVDFMLDKSVITDSRIKLYKRLEEICELAIKALEQEPCETIKEIPKDYKYDTETKDFLVYRHMYTGHEIHIEKPVPRYRLEQQPLQGRKRGSMTRNEAIEILSVLWKKDILSVDGQDALVIAIKALEKQKAISELQPPTDDWENYADRLYDLAYLSGYNDGLVAKGNRDNNV